MQLRVSDPEEYSRVSTDCSIRRMEAGRSEVRAEVEVCMNLSQVTIEEGENRIILRKSLPDGVDG